MTTHSSDKRTPQRPRALRVADRAIERRRAVYEDEVHKLIAAGFELVRRTGELEPKVTEIVTQAGLSNQTFYRHFRSKDELLLAMLDEGIRILRSYVEHRVESGHTPEMRIRNFILGIRAQATDPEAAAATRPFAISRSRLAEQFPAEVRESENQLTALLRDEIENAVLAGELRDANPERDARLIYNLAMGWVEREFVSPEPSSEKDAAHLVDFAMKGLVR